MRKRPILIAGFLVVIIAAIWWIWSSHAEAPVSHTTSATTSSNHSSASGFDKRQYSLTDPTSIWVIVNKQHPLQPINYAPTDLQVPNVALVAPGQANMQMRAVTATAIEQLFAGAKQAGYDLDVVSGYRSYDYQVGVYGGYVKNVGQAAADQESARPGYSEHQTGLAVDIGIQGGSCRLSACFGTTPAGQWLDANAYHYGFILRYPADKTAVTGYEYEPWHFRYVGTILSQQMHTEHIQTLEEFFGVTGGSTYATPSTNP